MYIAIIFLYPFHSPLSLLQKSCRRLAGNSRIGISPSFQTRAASPEVSLSETVSSPQSSHTLPTARYESLMSISHKHVFTYSNLATRCRKDTIMTFMAYPLPGYTVSFVPQNKIFCYQGADVGRFSLPLYTIYSQMGAKIRGIICGFSK